jgi:hypothetical protein
LKREIGMSLTMTAGRSGARPAEKRENGNARIVNAEVAGIAMKSYESERFSKGRLDHKAHTDSSVT